MTNQLKIVGVIIVAVAILIGLFVWNSSTNTAGSAGIASSTAPSLLGDVKITASLPPEALPLLQKKIADLREQLSKNYGDYNAWLNLAIYYKMAGDYDAARRVWEYLVAIHPSDYVALHNLADLYQHFLKDYTKAEMYFKAAIAADPTSSLNYLGLHELYRYDYKQNTTAAADILKEGIAKISGPPVIDLYAALAAYYQDKGDTGAAINAYTKAKELAQAIGNTQLAARFLAAIAALKK